LSENKQPLKNLKVDSTSLYREDVFTDLKVGTLRRLSPVLPDGSPDPGRPILFSGEAQVMTGMGAVPIQCSIPDATTLEQASAGFPAAMEAAVQNMIREAQEMRRQEASRIVVPGAQPPKLDLG
jgi:hypothetical protein